MAELATLARPYALAAFSLAQDQKALPNWSESLRTLATVAVDAHAQTVLSSPTKSVADKLALFVNVAQAAGSELNVTTKNLVSTLIERGRISLLPAISKQFEALKHVTENVAVANIRTAMPLTSDQKNSLQAALAKRYGKTITLVEVVDASLIAGAIISIGDNVIDGSASGRLATMTNELTA